MYFWNKCVFTNITEELLQTASYVTEIVKEHYIMKFLKKIVLYVCNKKDLSSYQICVNEPMAAPVSRVVRLSTDVGKVTRVTQPEHL